MKKPLVVTQDEPSPVLPRIGERLQGGGILLQIAGTVLQMTGAALQGKGQHFRVPELYFGPPEQYFGTPSRCLTRAPTLVENLRASLFDPKLRSGIRDARSARGRVAQLRKRCAERDIGRS